MTGTELRGGAPPIALFDHRQLKQAMQAARSPLLFGLRVWASVSIALYVAYWLRLDDAFWAGTSAAIVCQPQLGASLRKGWFRMIGTLVGARDDGRADCLFSARSRPISRRSRALGRGVRAGCHAATQLRGLCGGTRRLYGSNRRWRPARRYRRSKCKRSLLTCRRAESARSASASSAPASFWP